MAELYEHPDTGETVEIPDGAEVHRVGDPVPAGHTGGQGVDGELLYWRMPPHTPEGQLHPEQDPSELYEPRFDRAGGHRRALMAVTDEVDVSALGPRNTLPAVTYFLARNVDSPHVNKPSSTVVRVAQPGVELGLKQEATAEGQVQRYLDDLVNAGLLEREESEEGGEPRYVVTDAGRRELLN